MIFVRFLCNFSYYVYVCLQTETIKRPGDAETILMYLRMDKETSVFCLDKTFSIRSVQGVITCLREFLKSVFQQTGCVLLFPPALCRHMFCVNASCSNKRDHTEAKDLA